MEQTQPALAVQAPAASLAIQALLLLPPPPNSPSMTESKFLPDLSTSVKLPTEHFSDLKPQTLLALSSEARPTPEDLTGGRLTTTLLRTAGAERII